MVKKRIIFTLLYKNKKFVMSRNFKTNEIGDANWIIKNYNLTDIHSYLKKKGFIKFFKIKMKFRKSFEYLYINKNL